MNGPIQKSRHGRKPLLNLAADMARSGNYAHGAAVPKPFVVFVHGETWAGDPIARDKGSYATYSEAHVECAAWAKLHGEAWVEHHTGSHRAKVMGGWKRAAFGVVEDATIGPTYKELH